MNWKEMIENMAARDQKDPVLVTTATNGLKPGQDCLLAASVTRAGHTDLLYANVSAEDLQKSQEYHRITREDMLANADDRFRENLNQLLEGGLVLSYNTKFQKGFLDPDGTLGLAVHSMPALMRVAQSRMPVPADALSTAEALLTYADTVDKEPAFTRMCMNSNIMIDERLLPFIANGEALISLWNSLAGIEVPQQA